MKFHLFQGDLNIIRISFATVYFCRFLCCDTFYEALITFLSMNYATFIFVAMNLHIFCVV